MHYRPELRWRDDGVQDVRKKSRAVDPSDPQCDRVYSWEAAFDNFNVCALTLDECKALIDNALAAVGTLPVKVIQGPSNRYSWCAPLSRTISMQGPSRKGRGGMNMATVLHEVAHQIVFDAYGHRIQDHGPVWLAVYRKLLIEHGVITEDEFRLTARKFKLRWRRRL